MRVPTWIVALLALSACAEVTVRPADAGPPSPPDGSIPADLPMLTADYASCVGATAPVSHGRGGITIVARDLVNAGFVIHNVPMRYFEDNDPHAPPCVAPSCQEFVTDADASAALTSQLGGWSATHVLGRLGPTLSSTIIDSVSYNVRVSELSADVLEVVTLSQQFENLLWPGFDSEPPAGTGILLARAVDCEGRAVVGAVALAFQGASFLHGESSRDVRYIYLGDDSFPIGDAVWTMASGRVAAISLPVDGEPVRIEVWGRTAAGPIRLGCESVPLLPDGVTLVDVGPLRTDYAPGHPCAR